MAETMRAVVQRSVGEPEIMRVEDFPAPPKPQNDQVLIRVRAGGVCFHDLLVREGTYRDRVQLPLIPGHEMAGDVITVGENVTRIKPGDQVASTNRETCGQCDMCRTGREGLCPNQRFFGHNGPGAYAEFALVRENALSVVPRSIPPEIACTLSCAIGTELHGIRDVARTQAGDNVLVTGAGGGLGIHGVQVAKLCGAYVVALTTTPTKEKAIRAAGADEVVVINRGERFDQKLRGLAPSGFDVICDNVGEPVFNSCFRTLAVGGVTCSSASSMIARSPLIPRGCCCEARLYSVRTRVRGASSMKSSKWWIAASSSRSLIRKCRWKKLQPLIGEL